MRGSKRVEIPGERFRQALQQVSLAHQTLVELQVTRTFPVGPEHPGEVATPERPAPPEIRPWPVFPLTEAPENDLGGEPLGDRLQRDRAVGAQVESLADVGQEKRPQALVRAPLGSERDCRGASASRPGSAGPVGDGKERLPIVLGAVVEPLRALRSR